MRDRVRTKIVIPNAHTSDSLVWREVPLIISSGASHRMLPLSWSEELAVPNVWELDSIRDVPKSQIKGSPEDDISTLSCKARNENLLLNTVIMYSPT